MDQAGGRRRQFAAVFLCGVVGVFLAVAGGAQLGYGLYKLAYPTSWKVSYLPEDHGLGPPAITSPDTVWMNPTASNFQNLMVVGLATAAGILFLVSALLWRYGAKRHATCATWTATAVTGVFVLQLFSK
jgi:hypothetical protein